MVFKEDSSRERQSERDRPRHINYAPDKSLSTYDYHNYDHHNYVKVIPSDLSTL
jgi:hypothetical protein